MVSLDVLYYVIVPIGLTVAGYVMKSHLDRIQDLEKRVDTAIDETEVRTIIADKIDPIKEDIQEIKQTLNHILGVLLDKKPNS